MTGYLRETDSVRLGKTILGRLYLVCLTSQPLITWQPMMSQLMEQHGSIAMTLSGGPRTGH